MVPGVEKLLNDMIPDNAHITLSGKYFISLTEYNFPFKLSYRVISTYSNKNDLVQAILSATHLFIFAYMIPFRYFRKKYVCDGGIICNRIISPHHHNVIVSYGHIISRIKWTDFMVSISMNKANRLIKISKQSFDALTERWEHVIRHGYQEPKPHVVSDHRVRYIVGCLIIFIIIKKYTSRFQVITTLGSLLQKIYRKSQN